MKERVAGPEAGKKGVDLSPCRGSILRGCPRQSICSSLRFAAHEVDRFDALLQEQRCALPGPEKGRVRRQEEESSQGADAGTARKTVIRLEGTVMLTVWVAPECGGIRQSRVAEDDFALKRESGTFSNAS